LAAHLKKIVDDWKENRETSWNNADAILIAQGKLSDVDGLKITALQKYLLGYEFSNLVFVVTQNDLFVLVSKKRADRYFGDLEAAIAASGLGLKFHMLHEKKGDNGDNFAAITQGVKGSYNGRLLGTFEKEREFFDTGKVVPPLLLHLQGNTMTYVDIRKAVAAVFAIKDDDEIFTIKKVSQLAAKMLQKVAKEEVLEIADKAKSVPHKTFGAAIDGIIENLSSKPELLGRMNADDLESSYPTMLRTGSDAGDAFKLGMENADSNISIDVALLSIGINYLNYNGCVTRTIIFHPSRYQVDCYQILVEAFNVAIEAITPGEPIKNVYNAVHKFLSKSPIPKLANYLPKSVGHSIGIERNESLRLTASNNTIITPGMVFFLTVNLEGVPNPKKSGSEGARSLNKFTFAVGDTVLVLADKDQATDLHCSTLTRGASRNASSMVYKGKDGEDEEDDTEGLDVDASLAERSSRAAATAGAAGITKERAVEDKQRQLMLQKKAEFEASKKKTSARVPTVDEITDQLRKFKNPSEFPRRARGLKVYLDLDTETVFIPINQQSVPFHISTIKSVSMSEMGNNHILRFNFHTTASSKNTLAKDATKSIVNFCNQSPDYSFIKEISIKSHSMSNLKAQFRQIKELQKNNRAMMKQALEESNLVKQDRVRTIPNPPKLQDLQMRPSLRGRGTSQGTLECHQNGFRFRSSNAGERQEFAFNNIRHAFFQPCKKELTVLIHFHLKNPIIVGKKKTVDIQFFTEVVKSSVVIHSKSRMYDPEEIDEERRERKLRKRLNDLFDTFVKKCEKLVEQLGEEHLQFDIPFREFAFEGVPFKSKSVLMPTKGVREHCGCQLNSHTLLMTKFIATHNT